MLDDDEVETHIIDMTNVELNLALTAGRVILSISIEPEGISKDTKR